MVPKRIIVHHSKTKDGDTVSFEAIRRYHMVRQGWHDIGYHFLIEVVDGEVTVFCGRPLNVMGAHTRGENSDSIGVCFVGDYDTAPPDFAVLDKGAALIAGLCDVLDIDPSNIFPHKAFAGYKSCPGDNFSVSSLRELVRSKL